MDFRILGPLEVADGEEILNLGGPKQRAVLGLLLLDAGKVVSTDRLVDELWGEDETPERPTSTVQVYVSNLRKLLRRGLPGAGPDLIVTRSPGYLLHVPDGSLDLLRFEAGMGEARTALGDGDPALALDRYTRALAEWRGAALAGLPLGSAGHAEVSRLDELRISALEEQLAVEIDLRRDGAVGRLETLIAAHPFRERLRELHMLALYRAGRQADALRAYQVTRTVLLEELGIEPSQALQDLEGRILAQDPELLPSSEEPVVVDLNRPPVEDAPVPAPEPAATGAVRKTVTVVFADVVESTELGERLDPEALRRVMSRYFDAMRAAIERHGGTVDKFVGDAVMAVFGVPALHEDDALRAVRAAWEMRGTLDELNVDLERDHGVRLALRTGVNTGEVLVEGAPGESSFAVGDAVNVAGRLEQTAEAGEILIGHPTLRLVRDAVRTEPVVALQVRGKSQPIRAYRLLGIIPGAESISRRLDSPLVGRAHESAALRAAYERAVGSRACHLFTVLGPAGIGKSRLVTELAADVAGEALVLTGRCLPYGDGITFWPVKEVLHQAAGIVEDDSVEGARAKLSTLVDPEAGGDLVTERLAQLSGLVQPVVGFDELAWGFRRALEELAANRPLVLVLDDLQWGEPTLLDLVEHLADWSRGAPILLVCLARPELLDVRPGWAGGKLNATTSLLEPLPSDDCRTLLRGLLGTAGLAEGVEARIVEVADGNPLFVEEMLAMLVDDRLIELVEGSWRPVGDLSGVSLPPTIDALLAARLDRLPDAERRLLQTASVVGKVFWQGALSELVTDDLRPGTVNLLLALSRKELIRSRRSSFVGDDAYQFRHQSLRDAAYASLPKEKRASLHEAFASWLEQVAGERVAEYEAVLGHHLEQAYRLRLDLGPATARDREVASRAAVWLAAAGQRAFANDDARATVRLLGRAAELFAPDEPARLALLPDLFDAVLDTGDHVAAEAVATEAIEAGERTGDRLSEAMGRLGMARLRYWHGSRTDLDALEQEAQHAVDVAREVGHDRRLSAALAFRADMAGSAGLYAPAGELFAQALEHAERGGDRRAAVALSGALALIAVWGPEHLDECTRRLGELRPRLRGSRAGESRLALAEAQLEAMRGNFTRSRALLLEARDALEDLGLAIFESSVLSTTWYEIEALAGDPAAAEDELRRSDLVLREASTGSLRSTVAANLALALHAQRRDEEAERYVEEGRETADPSDVLSQAYWRRAHARILADRGQHGEAVTLAREAVAALAGTDMLKDQADTLSDLAEVLCLANRPDEAVPAMEQALELQERKGNAVAAARLRSTLERMHRGADESVAAATPSPPS